MWLVRLLNPPGVSVLVVRLAAGQGRLNNPTSESHVGIDASLASGITEPPEGSLDFVSAWEGLNNLTNGWSLGIASAMVSEIIEPPRDNAGYRICFGRGSIIPPTGFLWISADLWLVGLLNLPQTFWITEEHKRGSTIPSACRPWVSVEPWLVRLLNPPGVTVGIALGVEGVQ